MSPSAGRCIPGGLGATGVLGFSLSFPLVADCVSTVEKKLSLLDGRLPKFKINVNLKIRENEG